MSHSPVGPSRLWFENPRLSVDDTLFYLGLIHPLLPHCELVVDVGCGRGAYAEYEFDGPNVFDFRGQGRRVVGLDQDPAAAANPFLDGFHQLVPSEEWPVETASADLVTADWVLEHVENPTEFVGEVARVLRPGGAFVARSVSRRSLLALASRRVPNERHASIIRRLQPSRRSVDVFPAFYRMNSQRVLARLLDGRFTYAVGWRPGLENYVKSPRLSRAVAGVERVLPPSLQTAFVVCARRDS